MTIEPTRISTTAMLGAGILLSTAISASGQTRDMKGKAGFTQKLNAALPLETTFRDHTGRSVELREYFGTQPVVVMPVYYRCPMLCGLELNGLVRCLRAMKLAPGEDFQIVTFSIDPREEAKLAARKRANILAQYGRESAAAGWHFLTGRQQAIDRLCDAIGFQATFNKKTGQYAHAAGIAVCTPTGRVARYFFGVEFIPRDLRLGLVEASQNKIGTVTDRVLLYCYLYDPTRGKYGLAILRLIRAGGLLTVGMLVGGVGWMIRKDRLRQRDSADAGRSHREAGGRDE